MSQLLWRLKKLEPKIVDQSGFRLTPSDGGNTGLIGSTENTIRGRILRDAATSLVFGVVSREVRG